MRLANFGYCLSLLAIGGTLLPTPLLAAEPAVKTAPVAIDVALDADGSLPGTVVGSGGQAIAGATVSLAAAGMNRINVVTDSAGRFRTPGLRGGIYQVTVGSRSIAFRIWTSAAAPPSAQRSIMLVIDDGTLRGQTPIPDFFRSDAFLIGAVIVAAIAIPIAIHNFRNDHPSGS